MRAAVVRSFQNPPQTEEFDEPVPLSDTEIVVSVLAAGVHPRVRSQASGSHYTSTSELPLVPGVDGVGRDAEGLLRYFLLRDATRGSLAERVVVDRRHSVVLPDDTDAVAVAAAMNPAISSWIALRQRVAFEAGQNVLVLGATGNAGRLAVQIAARFGSGSIVAAARNADQLAGLGALGATTTVVLGTAGSEALLAEACSDVDVVLDYLWGEPAAVGLRALVEHRADDERPLTWIQIGSVAGPTAPVPSAALRATKLSIVGSGQGSVSAREILAELPALAAVISSGAFDVATRTVSLDDVEQAWGEPTSSAERLVVTP